MPGKSTTGTRGPPAEPCAAATTATASPSHDDIKRVAATLERLPHGLTTHRSSSHVLSALSVGALNPQKHPPLPLSSAHTDIHLWATLTRPFQRTVA